MWGSDPADPVETSASRSPPMQGLEGLHDGILLILERYAHAGEIRRGCQYDVISSVVGRNKRWPSLHPFFAEQSWPDLGRNIHPGNGAGHLPPNSPLV